MAQTWVFKKKNGAPAGTIRITIGGQVFVLDDTTNLSITVTDPGIANDLNAHPYTSLQSGTGTYTPSPVLQQPVVVNGVLSVPDGHGGYTPVASGGPGAAFYDIVGHSIPGGGGVTQGIWNGYVDKLMYLLGGVRRKRDLSIGGSVSCWQSGKGQTGDGGWGHVFAFIVPPGIGAGSGPYLPQADIAVCHAALNDLASLGSSNPTPMQEAHRSILGRLVASALAQSTDSAWTFTGTWALTVLGGYGSPTGFKGTTTVGDQAAFAVPSDYPGGRTIGVNLLVNPTYDYTIGVTIDGVAQTDVRIQGSVICDPNGYNAPGTGQFNAKCLRYPIAAAGAHSVVLTLKSKAVGASQLYIDSAHIESDPADGPIILAPNPHRCVNYSLWGAPWNKGALMSDAAVTAWQGSVATVLGEFGHVLPVDIDTVLGKSPALFSPDGAHPNDAGHGVIAQAVYDALQVSGRATSRQFSRVSPAQGFFWYPVGSGISAGGTTNYVPFQNSWVNLGAPYSTVAFRKDVNGMVHIKGTAKNGTAANAAIFTLPAGFRPAENRLFPGGAAAALQIQVTSAGVVNAANGGNLTGTPLDGISFAAEA